MKYNKRIGLLYLSFKASTELYYDTLDEGLIYWKIFGIGFYTRPHDKAKLFALTLPFMSFKFGFYPK